MDLVSEYAVLYRPTCVSGSIMFYRYMCRYTENQQKSPIPLEGTAPNLSWKPLAPDPPGPSALGLFRRAGDAAQQVPLRQGRHHLAAGLYPPPSDQAEWVRVLAGYCGPKEPSSTAPNHMKCMDHDSP